MVDSSCMADERPNGRRDERLIDLFLRGYKDRAGSSYHLVERPDRVERRRPAIDCIAVSERGGDLAIEHTLVEPFEGQKADDPPFLAVFERLHHAPELVVPNVLIDILVPVGAIPKGSDWEQIGQRVLEWFRGIRLEIPLGRSDHEISALEFKLRVHIEAMEIPDSPGVLVVGRLWPNDKPFSDVLRRALAAKLPKLVATPAKDHILLVEDASMVMGLTAVSLEIDAARPCFEELARVDSVWLAHTPLWDSEKIVWFFHVWPDGVRERFKVQEG
jgi:hypothetical protein